MKRSLLVVLASLASSTALAQTAPDSPASPATPPVGTVTPAPHQAADSASPTGAAQPAPDRTESDKTTTTTRPTAVNAPASWTDRIKLSGRTYLRYSYELNAVGKNANQFALDRLYLQGEFLFSDTVRVQVTLDDGDSRLTGTNNVFVAETKYAFVEVKNVLGAGTYFRGGMIPLAWVPYEEDLWGYRLQGTITQDRFGYIGSADLGLALGGVLPSKFGSWQVNGVNGEGFRVAELAKRKELQARLTLNPLAAVGGVAAGFFVTGYGSYGEYDDADLPARAKSRVIGQVGLQTQPLTLAAEYFVNRDPNAKVNARFTVGAGKLVRGQGLSVFGVLNVGAFVPAVGGLDLLGRYDAIDPDTSVDNNDTQLVIAGLGYRFNTAFKGLLNYERQGYAPDWGGLNTRRPFESRVKLQLEARF